MATAAELHRLVDQLAGKGVLDSSRRRAAFQAVRRVHFLPGVDLGAAIATRPSRSKWVQAGRLPLRGPSANRTKPGRMAGLRVSASCLYRKRTVRSC